MARFEPLGSRRGAASDFRFQLGREDARRNIRQRLSNVEILNVNKRSRTKRKFPAQDAATKANLKRIADTSKKAKARGRVITDAANKARTTAIANEQASVQATKDAEFTRKSGGRLPNETQIQFQQRMARGRTKLRRTSAARNKQLTKKFGHNPQEGTLSQAEIKFNERLQRTKFGVAPTKTLVKTPPLARASEAVAGAADDLVNGRTRSSKKGGGKKGGGKKGGTTAEASKGIKFGTTAIDQDKKLARDLLTKDLAAELGINPKDLARGGKGDAGERQRLALAKRRVLNNQRLARLGNTQEDNIERQRLQRANFAIENQLRTDAVRARGTTNTKIDVTTSSGESFSSPRSEPTTIREKLAATKRELGLAGKRLSSTPAGQGLRNFGAKVASTPAAQGTASTAGAARKVAGKVAGGVKKVVLGNPVARGIGATIKAFTPTTPPPSTATKAGEAVGSAAKTAGEAVGEAVQQAKTAAGDFVQGVKDGAGVKDSKTVQPDAAANPDAGVKDSKTVQPDAAANPDAAAADTAEPKPRSAAQRGVDKVSGLFKGGSKAGTATDTGDAAANADEQKSADRLDKANEKAATDEARREQKKNTARQNKQADKVERKNARAEKKAAAKEARAKAGLKGAIGSPKQLGIGGIKALGLDAGIRTLVKGLQQNTDSSFPEFTRTHSGDPLGKALFAADTLKTIGLHPVDTVFQAAKDTVLGLRDAAVNAYEDPQKNIIDPAINLANDTVDTVSTPSDLINFAPQGLGYLISGGSANPDQAFSPQPTAAMRKRSFDLSANALQKRALRPPIPAPAGQTPAPDGQTPPGQTSAPAGPDTGPNRTVALNRFDAGGRPINDPVAAQNNVGLSAAIAAERSRRNRLTAQLAKGTAVNPNISSFTGDVDPFEGTVTTPDGSTVPFNMPRTPSQKGLSIPTDLSRGTGFIRAPDGSFTRFASPQGKPPAPAAAPAAAQPGNTSLFKGGTPKTVDQALAQRIIGNGLRQQQQLLNAGNPSLTDVARLTTASANVSKANTAANELNFKVKNHDTELVTAAAQNYDLNTSNGVDGFINELNPMVAQGNQAAESALRSQLTKILLNEADTSFIQLFLPGFLGGGEKGPFDAGFAGRISGSDGSIGGGGFGNLIIDDTGIDQGIVKNKATGEVVFDLDDISPAQQQAFRALVAKDAKRAQAGAGGG